MIVVRLAVKVEGYSRMAGNFGGKTLSPTVKLIASLTLESLQRKPMSIELVHSSSIVSSRWANIGIWVPISARVPS